MRTRFRLAALLVTVLALLLLALPEAFAARGSGSGGDDDDDNGGGGGHEVLKLRVNDAIGRPGGTVAIVLRTYAARPIRQGQISVRVRGGGTTKAAASGLTVAALTQPVRPLTFLSAVVYSTR
ncbi:MAG TPA: hypothetical protein VL025_08280, partial [Thermoanaerobaculia bacterium]|nr:hypothetical protein [Thermoanaerobaculia bacterium]